MTLANTKARVTKTVIVQVSLTIATYDQNIFIVQNTGVSDPETFCQVGLMCVHKIWRPALLVAY
jgi:hypothetical protein